MTLFLQCYKKIYEWLFIGVLVTIFISRNSDQ